MGSALQACQHFRTLLDEDGMKQLDERLACYAAAQVMQCHPHTCRFLVHCVLAVA